MKFFWIFLIYQFWLSFDFCRIFCLRFLLSAPVGSIVETKNKTKLSFSCCINRHSFNQSLINYDINLESSNDSSIMGLMKLTKSFVEIPKRVRSSSAAECCFASSAANPKIQSTFKWKSKSFQVNMATARTWLCIVIEQDGFGQQFLALQLPQNSPIDTFCNPSNFCSVWRSCKFFLNSTQSQSIWKNL